jgi:hypothetical protein
LSPLARHRFWLVCRQSRIHGQVDSQTGWVFEPGQPRPAWISAAKNRNHRQMSWYAHSVGGPGQIEFEGALIV